MPANPYRHQREMAIKNANGMVVEGRGRRKGP
jgi:hypothetical protein